MVSDYCERLNDDLVLSEDNKYGWSATDFDDIEDCKSQVGYSVMRDELIGLLIGLLIQVHFSLVLYTHYKNSHLTKASGGCEPDGNPDVQMANVVATDESMG